MNTYKYKGITAEGASISGVIRAYDEFEAAAAIKDKCRIITQLDKVKTRERKRVVIGKTYKEKELALICSQFAIILKSGIPIVRCIEMVAAQTGNRYIRQMLEHVAEDVAAGYTMAQSIENNNIGLPATFIETVRAGEQSGTLEDCFDRLHKYYRRSAEVKAKVVQTLTYPAIVIFVAIIVFLIIMLVAVPAFTDVFLSLDVELPFITKLLIGTSQFMLHYWWIIIGAIVLFFLIRMLVLRTRGGRRAVSKYKLTKAPLHRITAMHCAAAFASTMSTMIAAGISIVDALDTTSKVITNYIFSLAVDRVRQDVETGSTLAASMAKYEYIPQMLTEMTGVGETSGSMETTLDVVGDYFNNEVEIATDRLLSILEPVITVGLALITVILLLAVYMPMFTLYQGMI